jgi:lambda family phage portal protein
MGRRTEGWFSSGASANAELGMALHRLRERSRELVRNNPYGKKALNTIVNNAVGTGIIPQAASGLGTLDERINLAWKDWSQQCDADGQLDFYGLQALATRCVVESGECLIRFRVRQPQDGLKIPLQLQVLEPDYLDSSKNQSLANGYILQGIEFDPIGTRRAYWLFNQHPGEAVITNFGRSFLSKAVPASEVLHIYVKERPGQMRAAPWMAPSMIKMKDLDDYEIAELVRKKIEACFAAFVTQSEGLEGPSIGVAAPETPPVPRKEQFEPGMVEYLKPGEDVRFGEPANASGYGDYTRSQLRGVAAGIGVTYEQLTGDLSNVNYSSYRAGHLEFRALMETYRWITFIPMFCRPVWNRFIDIAVVAGILEQIDYRSKWTAPAYQSIDPLKDSQAVRMRIRSGLVTLPEAIAQEGYDPDEQLNEIEATNKILDAKGIVLDCDPRKVADSGKVQTSPPEETAPPAP